MPKDTNITAAVPKTSTFVLINRLAQDYIKPYTGTLIMALLLMAISSAMTAIVALLMDPILEDVLGGRDKDMILPIGFAILATFIVRGLSTYAASLTMARASHAMLANIQQDLFGHLMHMNIGFFHNNPSGQLISRVVNDVTAVRAAMADSLIGFGRNFLTLVFLAGVMFYKDPGLTLAALVILPFVAGFVIYIGRRLRQISKTLQQELAHLSDKLSQMFQGIRQVQAYGMEEFETQRAGDIIDNVRRRNVKTVQVSNLSTPVNEILVGFIVCAVIVYGGHEVAAERMTMGQLGSFLVAFMMAYEPIKKLAKLNNALQIGLGAAERIFGLLDLEASIQDKEGAQELKTQQPTIQFDEVSFQYEGTDMPALENINFKASPGKVTALVGPSGGGKTTIVNLIPRFYDVKNGAITVDGQDVRDLTLKSLRGNIALVSQDITIFDDTIEANIAYGRPDVSHEEIVEAAKMAAADGFISEFPEGYKSRVGEDGVKLSGGQRQRIAIARAILHDAPILLLDEATSALDNESEKAVQEALEVLEKGRTTIVIAHRLSTVQNADQIIVLDKGQIVEQGTHDELLAKGGLYTGMYNAGLRDS